VDRGAHVYAPAAIGGHPDHELVRDFARELLRDGAAVSLYADQPYCYAYGWPHWVTGAEMDPHVDVDRFWGSELDRAAARVQRLDDARWERKLRAARLYRTQFPVLEAGANRRISNRDLSGLEVFWDQGTQA
jgi:LmbE family N-acetylglucosaminyl deacetylase